MFSRVDELKICTHIFEQFYYYHSYTCDIKILRIFSLLHIRVNVLFFYIYISIDHSINEKYNFKCNDNDS